MQSDFAQVIQSNNKRFHPRVVKGRGNLKPPLVSDHILLGVTCMLVAFSLLMIYSTTGVVAQDQFGDTFFYVKKQLIGAVLGFGAIILLASQPLSRFEKISIYCYPAAIVLLIATFVLGSAAGGAQRWINLGFLKIQPAEFVKICFVLFLAGYFSRHEREMNSFVTSFFMPLACLAPIAILLLAQPDFGSTAILAMVTMAMAIAAGVRWRFIGGLAGLGIAALGTLIAISPYRMARVMTFLSPMSDPQGKGYQLNQSLIAVAGGNLTGVGLGDSVQKLYFLPAAHTDFLYAVIAEEWGFIGAVVVLLTFLVILQRGFRIAVRSAQNTFAFTAAVGFTLLIVGPALTNIGVVTGLLPTKGLVLPLLGYGGSSLIASLTVVGILLALARDAQKKAMSSGSRSL